MKEKSLTIAPGAIITITFQLETVDFNATHRNCKGLFQFTCLYC